MTEPEWNPFLITERVEECLSSLEGLHKHLIAADEKMKSKVARGYLAGIISRFRLWCNAYHADKKTMESLDYKLRESSRNREYLVEDLYGLIGVINDALEIIHGNQTPWEDMSDDGSDFEEGHNSLDSESGHVPKVPDTQLQQTLGSMHTIIDALEELSRRYVKPNFYDVAVGANRIAMTHLEPFDMGFVRQRFPEGHTNLVTRLGKAITTRRTYLECYREREKKREKDTKSLSPQHSAEDKTNAPLLPEVAIRNEAERMSHSLRRISIKEPRKIAFPPMPPQLEKDTIMCSLCFRETPVTGVNEWNRHVLDDLKPYLCTLDNCTESKFIFESKNDWLDHEHAHRSKWECQDCDVLLDTLNKLREHISTAHPSMEQNSPAFEDALYESKRRVDPKLKIDDRCRLCLKRFQYLDESLCHLAEHQERLAILALTPPAVMENALVEDDFEGDDAKSVSSDDGVRGV